MITESSQRKIEYPDLPVVKKREEFLELLKSHQVIIVKADTGSGKSTQVPKFLLESGIAERGRIGVTEPRRLAALSIADRLREELKDETLVSTRIRFLEEGPKDAPIKVMTDGILLQEFRRMRRFEAYSAIMIDEAHERSLNIDILLGIFRDVLSQRPEFRLIIASATLDAKLFEKFYENSAILEAEGRMFPVEIIYADPRENSSNSKGDSGLVEEARDAILALEESGKDHLLCFLPTERDIQDLQAELLVKLDEKTFDVLPLFGRMSPQEQKKVFKRTEKTRIVLSTNIAETSLTIPGIAYVVDTGMARISRFNPQTRIQGLPVEKVSQSSARQRTGRAGRVKPGICVRLYTEEDFNDREEFTDPEIRRSNLSNVVLQLRSLGLSIEEFPFVQPPPKSAFRGAYKTLFELGALSGIDRGGEVTPFGMEMAHLPIDASLSAVLLRARNSGTLQAAIIVCSALSIQDPRLFPAEDPQKENARRLHRSKGGHQSDFLTFLAEWNGFCHEWKGSTWNSLRKYCERNFLHFLRCREWIDLYEQFCRILKVKFDSYECPFKSFHRDNLHIALLTGFLGGIARRDRDAGCYCLVGGRESHLFPGSDLAGKFPEFVLSAEVRETSRVFLTKNAAILPEWIIRVAKPFCTYRWFEPRWNPERGFVEAVEEVSFRGMVLSRSRRVDYGRVNPEEAAQIFFLEAVVGGDMPRPLPFMECNERVLEALRAEETRLRRWGICPSDDLQVDFLIDRAPGVFSMKTLKDFIEKNSDKALRYSAEDWIGAFDSAHEHLESFRNNPVIAASYRKRLAKLQEDREKSRHGGIVEYQKILDRRIRSELVFDSSKVWDGLSLEIPADLMPQLSPAKLACEIPKWRNWMIESLVRELPKSEKKKIESQKEELEDLFVETLEKKSTTSPLVCLYEALRNFVPDLESVPTLNPQNEHHLRLHVSVVSPEFSEKFSLEISPEWGEFGFFNALRPLVQKAALCFVVGKVSFGWTPWGDRAMQGTEAKFWQKFFRRVQTSFVENAALKTLFESRFSFLNRKDESGWALRSLCAMSDLEKERYTVEFLDRALARFLGVRTGKLHAFSDLSSPKNVAERNSHEGLVRLVFDSAYLGVAFFVKAWDEFRQVFADFRHGKSAPAETLALAAKLAQEENLYARICKIEKFLEPKTELSEWNETPEIPSAKKLRENFSPYLSGRILKDSEAKRARGALLAAEKARSDSEAFEAFVELGCLQENFALLRYKRSFMLREAEEKIEKEDLLKLRARFKSR